MRVRPAILRFTNFIIDELTNTRIPGLTPGNGVGHTNKIQKKKIETPHMHDPLYPGNIRPANNWEIPK